MSCRSGSCPAVPGHVLPFRVMSCRSGSCPAVPGHVLPFRGMSCRSGSCPAVPGHVLPLRVMSCRSGSCPAVPGHVLPFRVLSSRYEASGSHSYPPHSIRLLCMSDKPEAEISTSQHIALTKDKKHPCPGGIRTHNPNNRAAADPRLRLRGQGDRLLFMYGF
jgi:hypothetical protein